jgi:hypothetical protein
MLGVGLDGDQRAVTRAEGAHLSDQRHGSTLYLGSGGGETRQGRFQIRAHRIVDIVDFRVARDHELELSRVGAVDRRRQLAAQRHVDQHAVFDGARQRPDRVERPRQRKYVAVVDPAFRRLESDQAAKSGRRPDRAAGIGADRARREAGCDRDRRPRGGSTRNARRLRVARIDGVAKVRVEPNARIGELG